jgi:uncharacterized OsmC-like protein
VTSIEIQELYALKAAVLARRPEIARSAGHARVHLGDRLACHVEDGGRTISVDLPAEDGGAAGAPHPGQLMRASLGACLALGYRIWAARLGVSIERIELTVDCDYDARGQLGDATVAAGWQRVRIEVTAVSDAPLAEVRRVVETANRYSPMLANLSPDIAQAHRLVVVPATERAVPPEVTPSVSRVETSNPKTKGNEP